MRTQIDRLIKIVDDARKAEERSRKEFIDSLASDTQKLAIYTVQTRENMEAAFQELRNKLSDL